MKRTLLWWLLTLPVFILLTSLLEACGSRGGAPPPVLEVCLLAGALFAFNFMEKAWRKDPREDDGIPQEPLEVTSKIDGFEVKLARPGARRWLAPWGVAWATHLFSLFTGGLLWWGFTLTEDARFRIGGLLDRAYISAVFGLLGTLVASFATVPSAMIIGIIATVIGPSDTFVTLSGRVFTYRNSRLTLGQASLSCVLRSGVVRDTLELRTAGQDLMIVHGRLTELAWLRDRLLAVSVDGAPQDIPRELKELVDAQAPTET